jgi:hypothetical protein
MKHLLRMLLMTALVLSTLAGGKAQPTDGVTLASAEAVFETTTNDKDHDSIVSVTVKRGNTVIAVANNIGGHWNDHTTHNVALDVGGGWTRDNLTSRTKTELSFSTNGNDKWEFNYILRLTWSDGTTTEARYNGQVLTQDDSFRSYAVSL